MAAQNRSTAGRSAPVLAYAVGVAAGARPADDRGWRRPACASAAGPSSSAVRRPRPPRERRSSTSRAPSCCPASSTPTRTSTAPSRAGCPARPSPRGASSRSWRRSGGGSTGPSTRSRSTSRASWAPSTPRDRGRRSSSTTTPRLRSSRDPSRRCGAPSRRWDCAPCCATRRPTATASRGGTPASRRTGPSWRPGPSALTLGMVGAHASFTLSDESLDRLSEAIRDGSSSLHVHVAEDRADVEDSRKRCGAGVVERLRRHGLPGPRAILVHGVHLAEAELRDAQASGAWVIHCPRSNMNNAVGYAPTAAFRRAALGTDGLDADMLAEARVAFLKMRDAGRADAFAAALAMLAGGHRLAEAFFGLPLGSWKPAPPPTSPSSTTVRRPRWRPTTSAATCSSASTAATSARRWSPAASCCATGGSPGSTRPPSSRARGRPPNGSGSGCGSSERARPPSETAHIDARPEGLPWIRPLKQDRRDPGSDIQCGTSVKKNPFVPPAAAPPAVLAPGAVAGERRTRQPASAPRSRSSATSPATRTSRSSARSKGKIDLPQAQRHRSAESGQRQGRHPREVRERRRRGARQPRRGRADRDPQDRDHARQPHGASRRARGRLPLPRQRRDGDAGGEGPGGASSSRAPSASCGRARDDASRALGAAAGAEARACRRGPERPVRWFSGSRPRVEPAAVGLIARGAEGASRRPAPGAAPRRARSRASARGQHQVPVGARRAACGSPTSIGRSAPSRSRAGGRTRWRRCSRGCCRSRRTSASTRCSRGTCFDYLRPDQVSALMTRLAPLAGPERRCWSSSRRERRSLRGRLRYRIVDRENLDCERPARSPTRRLPAVHAARPRAHDARLLGAAQLPAAQRHPGIPVRPWGRGRAGPGRGGGRLPGPLSAGPLVSAGATLTRL